MKRLILIAAIVVGAMPVAWAATEPALAPDAVAVSDFHFFGRLDSWQPVDRDTLIVWASPFRPYLIDLSRGSPDLRFAEAIGVTSTVGKIRAKLDSVLVGGTEYPIDAIYKLSRNEARAMRQVHTVRRNGLANER